MSATNIQQLVQFIVQRADIMDIQASESNIPVYGRRRLSVDVHATQNWRRSTFVSNCSTSPVTCDDEGAVASVSVCRSSSTICRTSPEMLQLDDGAEAQESADAQQLTAACLRLSARHPRSLRCRGTPPADRTARRATSWNGAAKRRNAIS